MQSSLLAACAGSSPASQAQPSPNFAPPQADQSDDPPETAADIDVEDEREGPTEPKSVPENESDSKGAEQAAQPPVSEQASESSVRSLPQSPLEFKEYTWQDGNRTLKVVLQPDLALQDLGNSPPPKDAVADTGKGAIVKSDGSTGGLPVFKSTSGELMTLPGGVLLVLEPNLSASNVNSFFARNGVKRDKALRA